MAKIVVELYKFTPLWKVELLSHLIDDKIGHEEEVKEIRIED